LRDPDWLNLLYLAIQGFIFIFLIRVLMDQLAAEAGYLASVAQREFRRTSKSFAVQDKKDSWWGRRVLEDVDIESYVY
jgi:hypothetical protein